MQNPASESEQHIDVAKFQVTPPSVPRLTPVTLPSAPRLTAIIPAQTPDTPLTHTGLSRKQAQVLDNLARNVSRQTNYSSIGQVLRITKSAARNAVTELVSKGYISPPITIRDGVFQGFSYWIDNAKCQLFLENGGALNAKYHALTPPTHTVCPQSDPPHTISSSLNSDLKLTTKKTVDFDDPELLWWCDQGLTPKQIEVWLGQFNMTPEDLSQALRFARFDIVENNRRSNGELIAKPIDYFFVKVRASGFYPRPSGYKSVFELRAEVLEEQQRRDQVAKIKIMEEDIEVKFREFMRDKESPHYLEIFDSLNDFAKDSAKDNPFAFEIAMKDLFTKKVCV